MKQFDTLVEALQDLKRRGYTYNFNVAQECLECAEINLKLYPQDFNVTEFYRFEGPTDPADSTILYAIEGKNGTKGVLVNAYGVYSDPGSAALMAKLHLS
ncbi:phosphoribosylpyrophosphate synthetase [Adhaeribacter radiodurans]|uniref:Phosphoribosylpyrophosphate synthetase n=1 Tax=Adhaeribacter radiodurans TaxID=2745197 RepID=A0A7L7L7V7_9BACT|nr:phosphoribosylpyrophosphate synthetase [Adhaeribacter radiodurans]QMU28912.1 phosphoribosylpyrophosphate synthetase [Adhaeribacter radiodurans]